MEFFTFSHRPRPVRLSGPTRQFAMDSLNRCYGQDTRREYWLSLDDVEHFDSLSPVEKYSLAIGEIADRARIRICEGERLSGAATLGAAIDHLIPVSRQGKSVFTSVSHLTVDFTTVVHCGVNGIEAKVDEKLTSAGLDAGQIGFLRAAKDCVAAFRRWHSRYLEALRERPEYRKNYENLLQVPFEPARTFYEAVQSIWFTFAFLRLCGNWPGFGRLDRILGPYLEKDLESGTLTLEEAREILAHFFIKGCEWITGESQGSGDAQHYQNIVLAGVDRDGNEVANEVTYLILEVLEEFNIGDFPTTVRLNRNTPAKLLRRVAEVMKHGGGVLAVYNEEVVIDAMTRVGYALEEAREFANDGCWEMQVPGKTNFAYHPFDGLAVLLRDVLHLDGTPVCFASMEALKQAYFDAMEKKIGEFFAWSFDGQGRLALGEQTPSVLIALFEDGCIDRARDYSAGGAKYFVRSPHLGGAADVGNSLQVIDRLCFREKRLSMQEFLQILKENWENDELLRQFVRKKISCYGNDDDAADAYTVEVVDTFADLVHKHRTEGNLFFVPGVSTFGRQIEWSADRMATPHGYKAGEILAPNMSATPGSDISGATALIRSYCKLDLRKQTTGAALDLKLLPSVVRGDRGTEALMGLLSGFVLLGGCFLQPDVIDNGVLRQAQLHPENYGSLCIRISGWNARFVTLNKEWQDMCIEKTTHGEW